MIVEAKCKFNAGSNFDRVNQWVVAKYLDEAWVTGVVTESRVKLGGSVQHTVFSDSPTFIGEELRNSGTIFLVKEQDVSCAQKGELND
jgi:hypothetical protein